MARATEVLVLVILWHWQWMNGSRCMEVRILRLYLTGCLERLVGRLNDCNVLILICFLVIL